MKESERKCEEVHRLKNYIKVNNQKYESKIEDMQILIEKEKKNR